MGGCQNLSLTVVEVRPSAIGHPLSGSVIVVDYLLRPVKMLLYVVRTLL